jgi:peptidoglycan/LPS O-acetylase OafA/YrhL
VLRGRIGPNERPASLNAPLTQVPGSLQRRQDISALTGLRFFAAFTVAIAHGASISFRIENPSPLFSATKHWLESSAGFGMTLFFVLSGFVIHYNYRSLIHSKGPRGFAEFMWARFSRLYPLFIVFLIADLLIGPRTYNSLATDPGNETISILKTLPYFLTFTQSWFYRVIFDHNIIYQIGTALPVSWSISTEWFFYLFYPAIMLLIIRSRKPLQIIGLAVIWTIAWGTLASNLGAYSDRLDVWAVANFGSIASSTQADGQDSFVRWLLYFSPYLRIGEFILGCIAAQLFMTLEGSNANRQERNFAGVAASLAIVSIPILMYLMYSPDGTTFWLRRLNNNFGLAPSIAILLFCAARYRFGALSFLSARPIVRLGEASYSIYLIHLLVYSLICSSQGSLPARWESVGFLFIRLTAMLGFVLLLSIALFDWVENPARRALRLFWNTAGFPLIPCTFASAPLVAAIAVIGFQYWLFIAQERSKSVGIQVQSATYGANCGAQPGNSTLRMQSACDGLSVCDFVVDVAKLGDVAPGCGKDFTVSFLCAPNRELSRIQIPGEAGFKSVAHIDCSATPVHSQASPSGQATASPQGKVVARGMSGLSATYGSNCGARVGNATQSVAAACNSRSNCSYSVSVERLGDPAPDCGKDFVVLYSCLSENVTRRQEVPGEAGFGTIVDLSCAPENSEPDRP